MQDPHSRCIHNECNRRSSPPYGRAALNAATRRPPAGRASGMHSIQMRLLPRSTLQGACKNNMQHFTRNSQPAISHSHSHPRRCHRRHHMCTACPPAGLLSTRQPFTPRCCAGLCTPHGRVWIAGVHHHSAPHQPIHAGPPPGAGDTRGDQGLHAQPQLPVSACRTAHCPPALAGRSSYCRGAAATALCLPACPPNCAAEQPAVDLPAACLPACMHACMHACVRACTPASLRAARLCAAGAW